MTRFCQEKVGSSDDGPVPALGLTRPRCLHFPHSCRHPEDSVRHQESSWRRAVHVSAHLVSRGPDGPCDLQVPLQNKSVGLQLIRLRSKLRFLKEQHGGRFQMYVEEPYTVPNRLRRKRCVSHSRKPLFCPLGSLGLVLVPRSRLRHSGRSP